MLLNCYAAAAILFCLVSASLDFPIIYDYYANAPEETLMARPQPMGKSLTHDKSFLRTCHVMADMTDKKESLPRYATVLFDTGCGFNLMSRDFAETLEIPIPNLSGTPILEGLGGSLFESLARVSCRWAVTSQSDAPSSVLAFDPKFYRSDFEVSKNNERFDVIIGQKTIVTEGLLRFKVPLGLAAFTDHPSSSQPPRRHNEEEEEKEEEEVSSPQNIRVTPQRSHREPSTLESSPTIDKDSSTDSSDFVHTSEKEGDSPSLQYTNALIESISPELKYDRILDWLDSKVVRKRGSGSQDDHTGEVSTALEAATEASDAWPGTRTTKRKQDNRGSDEDSGNEDDNQPRKQKLKSKSEGSPELLLACPFVKYDVEKYHSTCKKGYATIHRLKCVYLFPFLQLMLIDHQAAFRSVSQEPDLLRTMRTNI